MTIEAIRPINSMAFEDTDWINIGKPDDDKLSRRFSDEYWRFKPTVKKFYYRK
jgi:hypothetical protein